MTDRSKIDHAYRDEITCPWCGCVYEESWQWKEGDHEDEECQECDRKFHLSVIHTRTYSTKKAKGTT